ncbi:hypothetical protein AGMMS49991_06250 [Spirochaetia bacterium]|nr:hypothetical protein AGMMS49991_06250 [Spirochaetia bacterium]
MDEYELSREKIKQIKTFLKEEKEKKIKYRVQRSLDRDFDTFVLKRLPKIYTICDFNVLSTYFKEHNRVKREMEI